MGQTFVRHAGHSEENEGIPWQGDLTLAGDEEEVQRYTCTTIQAVILNNIVTFNDRN